MKPEKKKNKIHPSLLPNALSEMSKNQIKNLLEIVPSGSEEANLLMVSYQTTRR